MKFFNKRQSDMPPKVGAHRMGASTIQDTSYSAAPYRLVILIALAVFTGESFVMIVLSFMPSFHPVFHALFDATMLILLISPVLYFFVLRPLVLHFTEFKRAQIALRDSERQLIQAEKMSSLGMLVSATAHELQNPNGVFTINLPILRDYLEELLPLLDKHFENQHDCVLFRMPYPEIRQDMIRLIDNLEESSRQINTFISNLKDFSRYNENQKIKRVNLKAVIDQVIVICGTQITKTIKSFTMDIPEDLPPVFTDSQALKQILINFLINAVQAADKVHSSLKLSAASDNKWPEHTIIEVSDNGCGMDDITRQKIFEPFFTTKSEIRGTGLGLYICYNLAESIGGRIEVESEPGKGSTFRVIVPNLEKRAAQN